MADIFYHGIKTGKNGERVESRAEALHAEMLERENAYIRSQLISREKVEAELAGAEEEFQRIIGESRLPPREKKEVLRIWPLTGTHWPRGTIGES